MSGGLISAALEQELVNELRRRGIVVWLDGTGYFTPFVDALAPRAREGSFPFPVVAFRGSFLELILALEPYGNGPDNSPLLIHMPGFTEESIRKTPILELYEPGFRFRKAPETLIREVARGRVAPEALEKLLAAGLPSLVDADAWLDGQVSTGTEQLAKLFDQLGIGVVLDHALELLQVQTAGDGVAGKRPFLAVRAGSESELAILEAYLGRQTGLDAAWLKFFGIDPGASPLENLALSLVGWLLCVEYVHDLRRPAHLPELARLRELSPPLVKTCQQLVGQLRDKHGDTYAGLADEIELHLHEELPQISPEDLGRVDTFRIEEARVLRAAVEALRAGDWAKAQAFADARTESSFWLARDQGRRRAWALVGEAAGLGVVIASRPRPLDGARTLEEAVARYAESGFEVDRAHRRFEQRQATLLDSQLPHFGDLKDVVRLLRAAHRDWADQLARDFAALCRDCGFLPESTLQQRRLFEQVVEPLAAEDRVALFMLDAFRFEMATELVEELKSATGTVVDLKPRLAELPTITAVGMNVLAPVCQDGRLAVAGTFDGFRTGEFTVRGRDDRARAISNRVGGKQSVLLSLAEVVDLEADQLKRKVRDARVVVVHGTELDDAGEANVGPASFELLLRQVRSAFAQLQKAGLKSFVFTADHGFLLLDDASQRAVPFGNRRDPRRRYVLDDYPRAEPGMVHVSLAALGYDGMQGYLLFREDTAVFATGNAGATFVHGGNSLQERVIPVLTIRRSRPEGKALTAYRVEAERQKDLAGMRHLRVRLRVAQGETGSLGFVAAREVSLGLRAQGQPAVVGIVKDLTGPGAIRDGMLRLPVSDDWSEVYFGLESPASEPVRVEVFHPEGVERVEPCVLEGWFEVDWRRGASAPAAAPSAEVRTLDWADAFADAGVRSVFVHLAQHGSITEPEVVRMLGNARAFRRFSLDFEEHLRNAPFRVRIEGTAEGKRYVKEGEK